MRLDFRRIAELLVTAGSAAILTMAYIVLTGRILGPAEYSDFSAALSLIYFFAVTTSPLTPTIGRMIAKLSARGDMPAVAALRNAVMARTVLWLGFAALTGVVLSPFIARWLNFRSAVPVALALIASLLCAVVSVDRGLLHGLLRVRAYNINTFVEAIVRLGGALLLLRTVSATASSSLLSYVAGFVVAEILILAGFRGTETHEVQAADQAEFKRLLIPMSILMLAVAILQNTDMLAVKRWTQANDAGLYGAAAALARGFGVIFVPLYVFSGPILAHAHEKGRRITTEALRLCGWFVAASAPALAVLALWSRPIVVLLYGRPFAAAADFIMPLAGVAIITYLALLAVQVFITIDDFRFLGVYIAGAILQIVLLVMFHASIHSVLTDLYVCQGAILLVVAAMLWRVRNA